MQNKECSSSEQLLKIILLGIGLLFLYAGFGAFCNIQEVLLLSIKSDTVGFDGNLSSIQTILAVSGSISTFLISFVITLIGTRPALVLGAIGHLIFVLSFLYPSDHLIYFCSVVNGFCGALLSLSRSCYVSNLSQENTIVRNLTVLHLLMNLSMFPGNLFVFLQFERTEYLDKSNRQLIILVLVAMMLTGIFLIAFIESPKRPKDESTSDETIMCVKTFQDMAHMFFHEDFIPLYSVIFALALVFVLGSNVGASIGFIRNVGHNPKKYIPLSGIAFGIGSFIGGLIPFTFKEEQRRIQLKTVIIVGFIAINISLWVTFLSFPNITLLNDASSSGIIKTNFPLILLILFMLGIGDFCMGLGLNTIISTKFGAKSEISFAVCNILLGACMALAFYGSTCITLYFQITLAAVLVMIASATLMNALICKVHNSEVRATQGKTQGEED